MVGIGSKGTSRRGGGVSELCEAINVYRSERGDSLAPSEFRLLARLANSSEAAKAFDRLKLNNRDNAAAVLKICIEADDLARTFQQRITKAKRTSARMFRTFTFVTELLVFVAELIDEQGSPVTVDPLSLDAPESSENVQIMWHALNLLAAHVAKKGTTAKEELDKLGATRKTQIKQAPENAAIGWLADGIRRVTGRAHLSAVRDVAEVIVGIEIPDLERVRRCARVRSRTGRSSPRYVQLIARPWPERVLLLEAIESAKRLVQPPKKD